MVAAGIGCTVVLPRPLRPREHACADRAPPRRGDGGRAGDAQADHGPAARDAARATTPARCGRSCRSGSALEPELARSFMDAFGPVLYNLYGSTEMSCATIATPARHAARRPGTVGPPVPHTRVVLARRGRTAGAAGRDRPHLRRARHAVRGLHGRLGRHARCRGDMMTAGDLGHLDAEGRLFVDAREDDMIVSGGENVYPGRGRGGAARLHPDVSEVVVVGRRRRASSASGWSRFVVPRAGRGAHDRGARRLRDARTSRASRSRARCVLRRRAAAQRARQGAAEES